MATKKNLTGQQYGKLLVVSEAPKSIIDTRAYWNCICTCGQQVTVATNKLTTGNTKSCGCLKTDKKDNNTRERMGDSTRIYHPRITSARAIWRSYKRADNQYVDFETFLAMSQQNCSYCGIEPSNRYNIFVKKKGTTEKAKREGYFQYNGLDCIDNTQYHTIDNVAPCCIICNMVKSDLTLEAFYNKINRMEVKQFSPIDILTTNLPANNHMLTTMKIVFNGNYKDGDISLEEFYYLSQLNCFYCNAVPSNMCNSAAIDKKSSVTAKAMGTFKYNGLDRVDSKLPHNKNNVVPCCGGCNFAKCDLSFDEFEAWVKRIKEFNVKSVPFTVTA